MHPNQNPVPPTVPQNQNQNQYQQYQQQHQQMLQQQQVPPGLGPQQAEGHPHTQVTVPPVVPPAPLGRHGTATPEQILAEASNTQLGAGLNPQPQHPQVSYTPAVGGNPPASSSTATTDAPSNTTTTATATNTPTSSRTFGKYE